MLKLVDCLHYADTDNQTFYICIFWVKLSIAVALRQNCYNQVIAASTMKKNVPFGFVLHRDNFST